MTIRFGEGSNMNWSRCTWFLYNKRKGIDERQDVLNYYKEHGGPIMISIGGRKYHKITPEELMSL